jgi:hypothetical protein
VNTSNDAWQRQNLRETRACAEDPRTHSLNSVDWLSPPQR